MSTHPFRPLRHRSVRLLWVAAAFSDIGTWVQLIVVGTLVARDTGSAVQTGLVALATFAPQGIAAPIGGVLADRFDRRRVFRAALVLQALLVSVLAIVLGLGVRDPLAVSGLILLSSGAGYLGTPSYAAMLPDLVPADELMAMVSLGTYSWNAGRIVGPALGTLLLTTVGPAWTIAFNAVTFIVLSVAVSLVRRPFVGDGHDRHESVWTRMRTGASALRRQRGPKYSIVFLVAMNVTLVPFMGLMPIYSRAVFGADAGLTGALSSAQGVGAIVGGVLVNLAARRIDRSQLLVLTTSAAAVLLVAFGLAPSPLAAGVVAFFLGGAWTGVFVTSSTVIQRDAESATRGRVMSIFQATLGVSYGLGLLLLGGVADLTSMRASYVFGGTLSMIIALLLAATTPDWRRVVDGVAPAATPDADPSTRPASACGG